MGAFLAKQVHGTASIRVTCDMSSEQVALMEADAWWTTEPGITLAVRTADCAPVLIRDRAGTCVAAIHAGWRGAVSGIVPSTLSYLHGDLEAFIGPCISQDVYEIGPEVASQIPTQFLKLGDLDRSYFNLRGLIKWQLEQLGVPKIWVSQECTYLESKRYFSARRGDLGRQYSIIRC